MAFLAVDALKAKRDELSSRYINLKRTLQDAKKEVSLARPEKSDLPEQIKTLVLEIRSSNAKMESLLRMVEDASGTGSH